jgi:hypothetical protein
LRNLAFNPLSNRKKRNLFMAQELRIRHFAIAGLLVASALAAAAQGDSIAAIQQKLEAQIKLTRTTADRSDIVKAGDIVELKKDNIRMNSVATTPAPENVYKDGRISQGWAAAWRQSMAKSNNGEQEVPSRLFVAGEKCWVTAVEAREDGAYIYLYSDPYQDNQRYYALVKFPYNKKSPPSADEVLKQVSQLLSVQASDSGGDNSQAQSAPAAPAAPAAGDPASAAVGKWVMRGSPSETIELTPNGTYTQIHAGRTFTGTYAVQGDIVSFLTVGNRTIAGGGIKVRMVGNTVTDAQGALWDKQVDSASAAPAPAAPAPAPAAAPSQAAMVAIPPPPPPSDAPPPTIAVGQTKDQVTAAFGQPARKATLGAKEIYFYKDMKVTFTGGKVSNVE